MLRIKSRFDGGKAKKSALSQNVDLFDEKLQSNGQLEHYNHKESNNANPKRYFGFLNHKHEIMKSWACHRIYINTAYVASVLYWKVLSNNGAAQMKEKKLENFRRYIYVQ